MTFFGPLSRSVALVGLLVCGSALARPAIAAPADVALIKSYLGDWRGRGTITGDNSETVICRLALTEGNSDKVNYNGRCAIAGNNLTISGTIAYIDDKRRFEAVMSSNAMFNGLAVGQKRNGGVVFNLRQRDREEGVDGRDVTITAQIVLDNSDIQVQFQVVYDESGQSVEAQVPFTKQ
ncbi:hypothetical protein [Devosia sp.]|uniref:hypothetical protein n=1 Tax=Devosia sp. TaxID=1871048 RepID=UPI003267750E